MPPSPAFPFSAALVYPYPSFPISSFPLSLLPSPTSCLLWHGRGREVGVGRGNAGEGRLSASDSFPLIVGQCSNVVVELKWADSKPCPWQTFSSFAIFHISRGRFFRRRINERGGGGLISKLLILSKIRKKYFCTCNIIFFAYFISRKFLVFP